MCVNVIKCVYLKYIYMIYIYIYIYHIYTVYIYTVYIYIYSIYIYIQYIIPKFRHRQQLNPPSRSSWHRLRPMFKGSRLRWDENFDRRKRGENHGRLPRSRRKHECSYECFIMWFIICLYYIYIYICVCVCVFHNVVHHVSLLVVSTAQNSRPNWASIWLVNVIPTWLTLIVSGPFYLILASGFSHDLFVEKAYQSPGGFVWN